MKKLFAENSSPEPRILILEFPEYLQKILFPEMLVFASASLSLPLGL
jgi:hypothetical protein